MNGKIVVPNGVRWLLVLPAAIGGYLVFQLLVIAGSAWVPEESLANQLLVRLLGGSVATALGFVLAGSKTAPHHRPQVDIVLAIIHAAVMGGMAFLALVMPQERMSDPKLFILASAVLGLTAAGGACYIVYWQERQQRTLKVTGELDLWDWYLIPSWRSFFTWPLALYFLGGAVFAFAWWVALQIDLVRWNFILWLLFGWNVPTLFSLVVPMGVYTLGFSLTSSV